MNTRRGQGTIEYLIIIAIVVVIALVVVGLLTGFFQTGSGVTTTQQQIGQQTQSIGLAEALVNPDGNYLLEISSNEVDQITITKISVDGVDQNFYTNNMITLGEKRIFQIPTFNVCTQGSKRTTQTIIITYIQRGIIKNYTYENIVVPCETVILSDSVVQAGTTAPVTAPLTYTLTLVASPLTGGELDSNISSAVVAGTIIELTADTADGYEFEKWSASAGTIASETEETTIFTMPAQNTTVTASFNELDLEILAAVGGFRVDEVDEGDRTPEIYFQIKNNFLETVTIKEIDINAINVSVDLMSNPKAQTIPPEMRDGDDILNYPNTGVASCLYSGFGSLELGYGWVSLDGEEWAQNNTGEYDSCIDTNPEIETEENLIICSGSGDGGPTSGGTRFKVFMPKDDETEEAITEDTTAGPYLIKITYERNSTEYTTTLQTDIDWEEFPPEGNQYFYGYYSLG